jgi:hypothetical protein
VSMIFVALAFVVLSASGRSASRLSRLMGPVTGLAALAAVILPIAHVHILWEGRVLGYGALLFAAARFGARTPSMANRAPDQLVKRATWYLALLGLVLLTCAIVVEARSLTMPVALGGDLPHPPARGLLAVGVWLAAVLAVALIGWPAGKRMAMGGLDAVGADGLRRFLIRDFLVTLMLASGAGAVAFRPTGHQMLGWVLGLAVGLAASGAWEVFIRANVVLRGPGPLIRGLGVLFIAAGVHGAMLAPSQTHPGPAALAAAILLSIGVWIERRVAREVLGLRSPSKSVRGGPSVS